MPLRDTSKYLVHVDGEPEEVFQVRKKVIEAFANLEFVDEGHKYFLHKDDGEVLELTSVSNVSHMFTPEFNSKLIAENYAKKHGETADYWIKQWRINSLKATIPGTIVHEFCENIPYVKYKLYDLMTESGRMKYDKEYDMLIPTRPKEEAGIKFFEELNDNVYWVMNEAKIYVDDLSTPYAGTFDCLQMWIDPSGDKSKNGLIIYDFKTNKDLYNDYNRSHGKMLYPPFDTKYFEESYSAYTLQLSCYQIALENLGFNVLGRRLVWLKDDGTYETVKVDDVTKEIREYFKK